MAKRPGGAMIQTAAPTQSELIPLLTKWGELGSKSQLLPMIVTIIAVTLMYIFLGDNEPMIYRTFHPQHWIYTSPFILTVATYLTLLSFYFIYRLVGKKKSWLPIGACMAFTMFFIWLLLTGSSVNFIYDFFHKFLAGGQAEDDAPFFTQFYKHFVGTGFFEELVKAAPLFIILATLKYMSPSMREKFKIEEPLDGILFGAAAGGGFALMETIGQYVPRNLVNTWMGLVLDINHIKHGYNLADIDPQQAWAMIKEGMNLMGTAPGVQLLIPRSLDEAFGHMAYSGLFGYFIGLSVMRPERKWMILLVGLVSSSIPHALWDAVGILDSQLIQMSVGLLSYAVLAAAVLKAREISPNRQLLQPSVVFGNMGSGPAYHPVPPTPAAGAENTPHVYAPPAAGAVIPMQAAPQSYAGQGFQGGVPGAVYPTPVPPQIIAQPNALPPAPPNLPPGTLSLRIGARYLVIVAGLRVLEHQALGLRPLSPGGPVAEVTRNPQDPSILGLTNLSTATWDVISPSGSRREIQSGQSVKLSVGTKINFGGIDGEVR